MNRMNSRVVMLGNDDFFSSASSDWGELYGTSTDDEGSNAWDIADTLLNKLGDFGIAMAQARANKQTASSPNDQEKWNQVMMRLEQMENEKSKISGNAMLIGGGILAAGIAFFALKS